MAGFSLLVDMDAEAAFKTARRTAKDLGYSVETVDDWSFTAQKGNLAASIFLGAFIAYCDFRVYVDQTKRDKVEISIERNSPWWTGVIGVNRVKNAAKALADAIEEAVLEKGGDVLKRGTF